MAENLFHPPCPDCLGELPDVLSAGLPLQGGDLVCENCKERFSYRIEHNRLTVKRISAPIGYCGPTEWTISANISFPIVRKFTLQWIVNDLSWKSLEKLIRDFEAQPQTETFCARSRFSLKPPFWKTRAFSREELQFLIPFLKAIYEKGSALK